MTLGDDVVNESRGKLLQMCEEAYDASEFIMGENDEKIHFFTPYQCGLVESGLLSYQDLPIAFCFVLGVWSCQDFLWAVNHCQR